MPITTGSFNYNLPDIIAGVLIPSSDEGTRTPSSAGIITLTAADLGTVVTIQKPTIALPFLKLYLPSGGSGPVGSKNMQITIVNSSGTRVAVFNAGISETDLTFETIIEQDDIVKFKLTAATATGNIVRIGSRARRNIIPTSDLTAAGIVADTGSTTTPLGAQNVTGTTSVGNPQVTMLTAVLGAFVYQDTNADIILYAFSKNTDLTDRAFSTRSTIRTHATNNYRYPGVLRVSDTVVFVYWVDNTTPQWEGVLCTLTGGAVPAVATVGTVVNDSAITAANRLTQSGGSTNSAIMDANANGIWVCGPETSAGATKFYHFTTSSLTLTFAANLSVAGAYPFTMKPISPASATCVTLLETTSRSASYILLTYSGGTITKAATSNSAGINPESDGSAFFDIDKANYLFGLYFPGGSYGVVKLNSTTMTPEYQRSGFVSSTAGQTANPGTNLKNFSFFASGRLMFYGTNGTMITNNVSSPTDNNNVSTYYSQISDTIDASPNWQPLALSGNFGLGWHDATRTGTLISLRIDANTSPRNAFFAMISYAYPRI